MEEKDLELGDYEVTWTLSGRDTLIASIRVTDTSVTCLSVTSGACNSATPPGVTISSFTVTGYLKSAVAEMTKGEFLTEIQNRGEVDLSEITTTLGWNKWVKKGYAGHWRIDYSDGTKYLIEIWNLHVRNPPTMNTDINFVDVSPATPIPIPKIETAWALARINALPFVGVAPPTGFDDWVDGKGGAAGIKGNVMVVGDIISGYLDPEHLGFSVTIFNVGTILSHYMG